MRTGASRTSNLPVSARPGRVRAPIFALSADRGALARTGKKRLTKTMIRPLLTRMIINVKNVRVNRDVHRVRPFLSTKGMPDEIHADDCKRRTLRYSRVSLPVRRADLRSRSRAWPEIGRAHV